MSRIQRVREWEDGWRGDLEHRLVSLRDVDLGGLSDEELVGHLREARGVLRLGLERHFRMHGALAMCLGEYLTVAEELLGWSDAEALEGGVKCLVDVFGVAVDKAGG